MCTIFHILSLLMYCSSHRRLFTQVILSGIRVIFHRGLKFATRILCAVKMQAQERKTLTVPPTVMLIALQCDLRVMHCGEGGREWTTVPHVFTSHRHNDNTTSDNTRRRPFVQHKLIYREGVTRFEKLANSACWKASLGLGCFWNHV